MRLIEQGKAETKEYDSLGIELNKSLANYDLFIEKHWNENKTIEKTFTKEQIKQEKQRGYSECNCDTCYFKIRE